MMMGGKSAIDFATDCKFLRKKDYQHRVANVSHNDFVIRMTSPVVVRSFSLIAQIPSFSIGKWAARVARQQLAL